MQIADMVAPCEVFLSTLIEGGYSLSFSSLLALLSLLLFLFLWEWVYHQELSIGRIPLSGQV